MSERQINDPQPTPQAPASVDAAARELASARRRRFIKLGGAAVPTALTLASRPVMAWHCNTASTWGSAQGMSNSSYVRSREANVRLFADETYTVANWISNTGRGPLSGNQWSSPALGCSSSATATNFFKKYTVASLLQGYAGASIMGISDLTDSVWNILKNDSVNYPLKPGNSSTEFTRLMLAAWLNYRVLTSTLNKCLMPGTTNVLIKLGNTSYIGPTGVRWGQAEVIKYLKGNFVACNNDNGGLCN